MSNHPEARKSRFATVIKIAVAILALIVIFTIFSGRSDDDTIDALPADQVPSQNG